MSEFTDSFHKLTTSIISLLVAFLLLKDRANDSMQTPLATHPSTMLVAISSFIVYYLLHVLLLRSRSSFAAVAEHFLVWSAYATVATLAAPVFPDRASPFLYAIFGLLSAGEVLYMFDDKVVIEGEVEIEVKIKEEEGSKIEVCRRRVCRSLKHLCCRWSVDKFFREQPPPIAI